MLEASRLWTPVSKRATSTFVDTRASFAVLLSVAVSMRKDRKGTRVSEMVPSACRQPRFRCEEGGTCQDELLGSWLERRGHCDLKHLRPLSPGFLWLGKLLKEIRAHAPAKWGTRPEGGQKELGE